MPAFNCFSMPEVFLPSMEIVFEDFLPSADTLLEIFVPSPIYTMDRDNNILRVREAMTPHTPLLLHFSKKWIQ